MKYIVAIAIALFSFAAQAVDFEVGVGRARHSDRGDGFWIQEGFPHQMHMKPTAFEIGLTGVASRNGNVGVAWHADWAWLGMVRTQSYATPLDANYDLKTKQCVCECLPMANFVGAGHDHGFILSFEPFYETGDWRFGVEIGPYIHKSTWHVNVYDLRYDYDSDPTTLDMRNEDIWQVGGVFGWSISRKNLTLSYQYFKNKDRVMEYDTAGAVWSRVHMVSLKYKF